ncbi:MAG: proline dehydrogenase family protein [Fermentimonas sp.]|jgi:proline dehydrogenase
MRTEQTSLQDFHNTEIAFRDQSNYGLRQAYLLFKVMNNRSLVEFSKRLVNFALAIRFPVKGIIKKTIYRHFVGGSSLEDCENTINRLARRNVLSIMDYAQEGRETDEVFDATCREVIRTVEFAKDHPSVPFSVFKITGIGRLDLLGKVSANEPLTNEEQAELKRVEERVEAIYKRGYELGVPVMVDAEHSWIQPVLDDMVMKLMARYNKEKAIVQNTYQLYRHDGFDRMKKHHEMALQGGFRFGLKIVRGAYMEMERERAVEMNYPCPIQPDKVSTDRDFDAAIRYLLDHVDTIDFMVATHNEESSLLLANLIDEKGLPRNHPAIFFSQLYGMSDNLTHVLAEQGYNVAKYVPYGKVRTMMPYLFRRAEENSSVEGQTSRELQFIQQEIKRRKSKVR